MSITTEERSVLRELAKRVAEIAALPIMAERREMWGMHNRLEPVRPMVLVFPEGAWRELLPESCLVCESEWARRWEWGLRSRVYYYDHLRDDTVIEGEAVVGKVVRSTGWGIEPKTKPSTDALGAWAFDPVIHRPSDLKKIRHPEISYDEAATERDLELAREVFGDILDVKLKGVAHVSFHMMQQYCTLRGLEEVMVDMVTEPGWVHEAMEVLCEGHRKAIEQLEGLNLLSVNNDGTYHSTGGNGYTSELPKADYDPERIRPCDMWASAESQELAQVSPAMHAEFALAYEKRLLERFGLNGYGCCEDLTLKLDDVLTIPNIRRISISPFADVAKCAERLRGDYIFSWKPHPAHLAGEFDAGRIRRYIREALEVTRGCVVEMVLKDTHTCDNHPERFTEWTEIARDLVGGG